MMSVQLECRKINDTNVPIIFKFGTIRTKSNSTTDQYMSLDIWTHINDRLNTLLADDLSNRDNYLTIDVDAGRLTLKTLWVEMTDKSGKGLHILKMLDLRSTDVGNRYVQIDVDICVASELKEPKQDGHTNILEPVRGLSSLKKCFVLIERDTNLTDYAIKNCSQTVSYPSSEQDSAKNTNIVESVHGLSSWKRCFVRIERNINISDYAIENCIDLEASSSSSKRKGDSLCESPSKTSRKHVESSQDTSLDVSIRYLIGDDIDPILATYPEHEQHLTELYTENIKQLKRNYKPKDIPELTALYIVSSDQFDAMVNFLVDKLVVDAVVEHMSSNVIFDLLIPEWTVGILCGKLHCTRVEALEKLRLQRYPTRYP